VQPESLAEHIIRITDIYYYKNVFFDICLFNVQIAVTFKHVRATVLMLESNRSYLFDFIYFHFHVSY